MPDTACITDTGDWAREPEHPEQCETCGAEGHLIDGRCEQHVDSQGPEKIGGQ